MKRLVFKELQILSLREKKAIKVKFDSSRTIIKGSNQIGKSSLIKSIYYTLGANPAVINDNWMKIEPISLLRFSVDDLNLSIVRYDKKTFIVIDENNHTNVFNFKELSIYLNNIFDFNLVLTNRQGDPEIPPPTYLFLPFYVDQDKSWSDNLNSFSNLNQFSTWKKSVLDYHSGIRGNEYYKTKSEFDSIKNDYEETEKEINTLNRILVSIKSKLKKEYFDVDIDSFSNEIAELLSECEKLKEEQFKLKQKLTLLYDERTILQSRLSIVTSSMKESELDYEHVLKDFNDYIDCPTCGASYENDFSARFSIVNDVQSLQDILIDLKTGILAKNEEIRIVNSLFTQKKIDFERIQELLNKKKSDVKLSDIIENEGKKRVQEVFQQEQNEIYSKLGSAKIKLDGLDNRIKLMTKDGQGKKTNIMNYYREKLKFNLDSLNINVDKTSPGIFERMDSKIKEQGSNLPRALLGYYFAILQVMNKYSTSTFCPIVIDSPNQQEQDEFNLKAIMDFILNNQPKESQLILSLVDDSNTDFGGKIIELPNDKYSLLKDEYYDEVYAEIMPVLSETIYNDRLFL